MIRTHSLAMYGEQYPEWKCLQGWMDKFVNRSNLSLRTPTEQKGSALTLIERNEKIQTFWRHIIAVRTRKTINKRGSKFALVKTNGGSKKRCTVVLTCCADGRKLPPMIVFKGKKANHKSIRQLTKRRGTNITVQKNAWMDSCLYWILLQVIRTKRVVIKSRNVLKNTRSY